jgi:hypothetical protein
LAFNVQDFKANGLVYGGARPTNFEVSIFAPFDTATEQQVRFLCRAASLPPSPVDAVPVPYFGRKIKLAGDRDFPDWTVTILNDEDFALRKMFEKWSNLINTHISNRMNPGVWANAYKTTALITQFGRRGNPIREYEFQGIFPTNVDAIGVDWDQTNAIEQFDVTFAYDLWVPTDNGVAGVDDWIGTLSDDGLGG